jgi:DNA polymerase elongation subunit (family B)
MNLRVIDGYYERQQEGFKGTMPVLHVLGRDQSWERHHVPIAGYRPYFAVRYSEWQHRGADVADDDRVLRVETEDREGRTERALDGERLVRVVCADPSDVGDLREVFEDPMEADVLFPVRFLVDMRAFQWLGVPDDYETYVDEAGAVPIEEVSVVEDPPEVTPPPRVVTYDIEVQQGGSGPPVVTEEGTEQARNDVTAIAAHDSYTDDEHVWVLAHRSWDVAAAEAAREAVPDGVEVSIYSNPRDVVGQFCEWVTSRDADVLTGWNASGFDHPYLVNYALRENVSSVYDLSPTGDVYDMNGDGRWINSSLKGRVLVDLLDLYKKTEIHELASYSLADVAEAEDVSVGKLDIGEALDVPDDQPAIDFAWREDPATFVEYSLRDVRAAVAINRESKENVSII